jgi:hypothetical protein
MTSKSAHTSVEMDIQSKSLILSRSVQFDPSFKFSSFNGPSRFGERAIKDAAAITPVNGPEFVTELDLYSDSDDEYVGLDNKVTKTKQPIPSIPPSSQSKPDPTRVSTAKIIGDPHSGRQTRGGNRALLSKSPVLLVTDPPDQYWDMKGRSDAFE